MVDIGPAATTKDGRRPAAVDAECALLFPAFRTTSGAHEVSQTRFLAEDAMSGEAATFRGQVQAAHRRKFGRGRRRAVSLRWLIDRRKLLTRHAESVLGALVALSSRLSEPVERFALVLVRADPDLGKVAAGVLRLGETELGRLLGPEVRLGVGLRKNAGRADEVPRREREAGRRVILLRGNVCRGRSTNFRQFLELRGEPRLVRTNCNSGC